MSAPRRLRRRCFAWIDERRSIVIDNRHMADDATATRYHRLQLRLGVLGFALGVLSLVAVLFVGAAGMLTRAARAWPWWAQVALVAATLGAAHRALVAPLSWLSGWWLPRRYRLLHQSFAAWLADQAKALALSV